MIDSLTDSTTEGLTDQQQQVADRPTSTDTEKQDHNSKFANGVIWLLFPDDVIAAQSADNCLL